MRQKALGFFRQIGEVGAITLRASRVPQNGTFKVLAARGAEGVCGLRAASSLVHLVLDNISATPLLIEKPGGVACEDVPRLCDEEFV